MTSARAVTAERAVRRPAVPDRDRRAAEAVAFAGPVAGLIAPRPEPAGTVRRVVTHMSKPGATGRGGKAGRGRGGKASGKAKVVRTDKNWTELSTIASVANASWLVRRIIEFCAGSADDDIEYQTLKELIDQAKVLAADPPKAFFASLSTLADLKAVEEAIDTKSSAAARIQARIDRRRSELVAQHAKDLHGASGSLMHVPDNPTGYRVPAKAGSSVAKLTGRADAEFPSISNPYTGAGGQTTAAVNVALLEAGFGSGAIMDVGPDYYQFCPFCNKPLDARLFEVDHQQPWSDIRERFRHLAEAMSASDDLFDRIKKESGAAFTTYFKVTTTGKKSKTRRHVELTGAGANMFSNDMGNLVRVCRICNAFIKKDDSAAEWLAGLPLFGPEFVKRYVTTGPHLFIRTNGKGLGELVLEWFDTHILPVMKHQESTIRLSATHRNSLVEEAGFGVSLEFETDTAKKAVIEDRRRAKRAHNEAFEGAVEVQDDYFSGTPAPWAPNSPKRYKREKQQVDLDREKRKREEGLSKTQTYAASRDLATRGAGGLDVDGLSGDRLVLALAVHGVTLGGPTGVDPELVAAAAAGYREGRRDFDALYRKGADAALGAARGTAAPPVAEPAFGRGYGEAAAARDRAFAKGQADGRVGRMDIMGVFAGRFGGPVLVGDYQDGFNSVMVC